MKRTFCAKVPRQTTTEWSRRLTEKPRWTRKQDRRVTTKRKNEEGSQPPTKTNHQKQDSAMKKKLQQEQEKKLEREAQKGQRTRQAYAHSLTRQRKAPAPTVPVAAANAKEAKPAQVQKWTSKTRTLNKEVKEQFLPLQTTKLGEPQVEHQRPKTQRYMQRYKKTRLSGRRTLGTKMIEDQTNEEKEVRKKKMVTNAPGLKAQTKS